MMYRKAARGGCASRSARRCSGYAALEIFTLELRLERGLPLPPRSVPLDPEVVALSTTIERDPGDFVVEMAEEEADRG
jgi:hypothetical protein